MTGAGGRTIGLGAGGGHGTHCGIIGGAIIGGAIIGGAIIGGAAGATGATGARGIGAQPGGQLTGLFAFDPLEPIMKIWLDFGDWLNLLNILFIRNVLLKVFQNQLF